VQGVHDSEQFLSVWGSIAIEMPQMLRGAAWALLFGCVSGAHSVNENPVKKIFVPLFRGKKLDFIDGKNRLHHLPFEGGRHATLIDNGHAPVLVGFFVAFLVIFFVQPMLKIRHGQDEGAGGGTSENIGHLQQSPWRELSGFASGHHCVKKMKGRDDDGSAGSLKYFTGGGLRKFFGLQESDWQ
jgi:hypothetical protein